MEQLVLLSQEIGSAALEILQTSVRGQVTGQTSGGVFLRTNTERILFLSFASWRGPLTINLPSAAMNDFHLALDALLQIETGTIHFTAERITVEFSQAECWSPPPRPQQVLPQAERERRYAAVAAAANASFTNRAQSRPDARSSWVGPSGEVKFLGLSAQQRFLAASQPEEIVSALVAGLGLGPGLTPAGDDMALGFLLALNRWGDRLRPDLQPETINQALMNAARLQTSALSSSLIEYAAAGLADERLISALDGLVSGNLAEERIVENLLGWGHTSGAAALQGMGLALGV